MAVIAFDAQAGKPNTPTVTSITWAHTCTGSNLVLFVWVGAPATDIVTGVTYNAVAMTLLDKQQQTGAGSWQYLFYLIGPATGANNVVASMSASDTMVGSSASYTGVKQSGIPDATSKGSLAIAAGASITGTVTTIADNCWTVMGATQIGGPISAGASTTSRDIEGTFFGFFDSNAAITPAGSNSLKAVNGDSVTRNMAYVIASFAPFIGGGSPPFPYAIIL